ncbi:RyR domain-containing protein [Pelotomaculum propionicicum]|uniref:RyR domain-containing protein n=1 Tax=Pelotomaculum propionicicum TaxID=258475 RepID=UPI003B82A139
MSERNNTVVASGDICINKLLWTTSPQVQNGWNWQTQENMSRISVPGESMLLARLISLATGQTVLAPDMRNTASINFNEFLHSTAEIELFPRIPGRKDTSKVYRTSRFLGFTGTPSGLPKLLPVFDDDADAAMVVIDDENNGFNEQPDFWPLALKSAGKNPLVLYKVNNPNMSSALWKHLVETHIEKMIIIINSEDLRAKGVNISKSISWERTAQDFVWQLNNNPNLSFLVGCRHLIFTFGLEGAIYYKCNGVTESRLYFMPYQFEGDFLKEIQGGMYGYTSCFVAGLVKSIVANGMKEEELVFSINDGIREGIVAAQKYYIEGFGGSTSGITFPNPKIFSEDDSDAISKESVQDVKIHIPINDNSQDKWYILNDKSPSNLVEIAAEIVKNGDEKVLKFIPVARFGQLKTVDRTEIESYRSINNLMGEYIATKNALRPLSIAVFGTPGSGKSFGVTEVAANIAPDLITKLNFNLSQFRSPSDLAKVFHKARDFSLRGKVPLIVFDEFDTSFEGKLGWLKYFLAPMQDGLFREEDAVHPIGKAIFVFAGGTSSTFEEFCGETITDEEEKKRFVMDFKSAKGPDFISRLRGNVNILGPNPANHRVDQLFVIRRAMLLRSFFERKLPHLINDRGEAQIDNGVLRALLKVPRYKHESRSMEAIMDMSILTNAKKWEQSHLPSKEQLKLHVDEEQFTRHLMHDVFYSEKIESLTHAIFEMVQKTIEKDGISHETVKKRWEAMPEDERNFYREHIRQIPDAMVRLQYDIVSVIGKSEAIKLSEKEILSLAEYTHDNWFAHRKELGWKFGVSRDEQLKTDPNLVSWDVLNEEWKKRVSSMVEKWPAILANAHFKVEYLKPV